MKIVKISMITICTFVILVVLGWLLGLSVWGTVILFRNALNNPSVATILPSIFVAMVWFVMASSALIAILDTDWTEVNYEN